MEILTFKSLITQLNFDDIEPEFKIIFQKQRPDLFEQTDWGIYKKIYQDLQTRKASDSKYSILVNGCWKETVFPSSNCCAYYDTSDDDYDYRSIGEYTSLSEVLGMKITVCDDLELNSKELAAGILWEITYAQRSGLANIGMEHLTFKYLLTRFNFDDILNEFKALYQRNHPKQASKANWEGYREVYQMLQGMEVSESKYFIFLVSRWEGCSPLIDMNCSVYDKDNDEVCQPMATYPSWSELLGMHIITYHDIIITPKELTAGLLWEITYYGNRRNDSKTS